MSAKWKRLGFSSQAAYRETCSRMAAAKNDALSGSSARHGQRMILQHLIFRSDFHSMRVTITKSQIERDCGLERKAVQRALKFLRDEGTIEPVENFFGGRGRAVTYEIRPQGVRSLPDRGEDREDLEDDDQEAIREFSRLVRLHGYAKARELVAANDEPERKQERA